MLYFKFTVRRTDGKLDAREVLVVCSFREMRRFLWLCIKMRKTGYDLHSERAEARSASRSKVRGVRLRRARDGPRVGGPTEASRRWTCPRDTIDPTNFLGEEGG